MELGVAATDVQSIEFRRQSLVVEGAEGHQLGTGLDKKVEVVAVVEAEGGIFGDADSAIRCHHRL